MPMPEAAVIPRQYGPRSRDALGAFSNGLFRTWHWGGLTTTYGDYRRNHQLLTNVFRDAELPGVATRLAHSAQIQVVSVLDVGWTGSDARIRAAALGHSLDFSARQSLTRIQGLSDAEAGDAMIAFVKAVALA